MIFFLWMESFLILLFLVFSSAPPPLKWDLLPSRWRAWSSGSWDWSALWWPAFFLAGECRPSSAPTSSRHRWGKVLALCSKRLRTGACGDAEVLGVFVGAELRGGPVDGVCGAEHRPTTVQELRLHSGVALRPAGRPGHDHHQLHAGGPQPPHHVLRRRLHHLHSERRRQTQDQPGGRGGSAAGRTAGHHPRQLVRPHHREGLQQPAGPCQHEEGDGGLHLFGLGRRRAAASGRRSAVLLQPAQIQQPRANRQVLQQQRSPLQQKLRVESFREGTSVERMEEKLGRRDEPSCWFQEK